MPPELAGKIAAGEVVQRPASVVKELLDNAIDAGADRIRIVIANAGRALIQVTDNGSGMGSEDLPLCFEQHATSKIREVDDLYRIRTLGFRGEAMASIASISRVEVRTRRHDEEAGTLYRIEGGEEKVLEPVAAPEGTTVSVRQLFYNVPARRQFLKTDATEFRHILGTVQHAALAHPEIAFEMEADGDSIFRLPVSDLDRRAVEMFGKSYRGKLIPFDEETSYLKIRGVLSDPSLARKSRGEQFLFVNGRPIRHRYLTHLILSLYEQASGEKGFPFFALFLEVDPRQVDVNVHPAKLEVKFEDEKSVVQLTRSVIRKALNHYLMVPQVGEPPARTESEGERFDLSLEHPGRGEVVKGGAFEGGPAFQIPSRINFDRNRPEGLHPGEALYEGVKGQAERVAAVEEEVTRRKEQGFWQLHERYILCQTRTGLCLVDQHRAHMRIIYEKALGATEEALPGTQQLLFAQTVEFSAADFSLLEELLPILQRMGFSIQLLSGRTAVINGVPADIDVGNEQTVLPQMLQSYRELDRTVEPDARRKIAAAFSARTAIPGGKRLLAVEMEMIVDQLFACEDPYRDPFGKPTLTYLPLEEIARRLKQT